MAASFLNKIPTGLKVKVDNIIKALPQSEQILEELYQFACNEGTELSRKRAKQDEELDSNTAATVKKEDIIMKLSDVTVLSPLRKKLDAVLHVSNESRKPMLSLTKNDKSEMSVINLNQNIKMATFLPVPEKQNIFYVFINYYESLGGKFVEPILFTVNKESLVDQFKVNGLVDPETKDFTVCIEYIRKQAILTGFRIYDPFYTVRQDLDLSPSFHVEGHRGTKEGTLYFLPDNIIFGFKKPILLFESKDIESISYSSITRLTFNITLITTENDKFEFSMIDQSEYAKIDDYVKRKQVKDRSMSEELKAKSTNKNQQQQECNKQVSALEEATQQLESGVNIQNVAFDSDDEENDINFEAGSDLSDGSDLGEEEDDENEDEEQNENDVSPNIAIEDATNFGGSQQEGFSIDLGVDEIPIELDDDGSGVEYD